MTPFEQGYTDTLLKLGATDDPEQRIRNVRRGSTSSERMGSKLRNVGYPVGLLSGAGALVAPRFIKNPELKLLARGLGALGAVGGIGAGMLGEQGMRVGRGYGLAADRARARQSGMSEDEIAQIGANMSEGWDYSPSAYRSAENYLRGEDWVIR